SCAADRMCMPTKKPTPPATTDSSATISRKVSVESGRGGAATRSPICPSSAMLMRASRLPGENVVDELLTPRRLVRLHQAAAAAVGNARLGDLVVGNHVLGRDIDGTHDAGDVQHADLVVHADLLRAADNEIAVGQHVGDNGGHHQLDLLGAFDAAEALG